MYGSLTDDKSDWHWDCTKFYILYLFNIETPPSLLILTRTFYQLKWQKKNLFVRPVVVLNIWYKIERMFRGEQPEPLNNERHITSIKINSEFRGNNCDWGLLELFGSARIQDI